MKTQITQFMLYLRVERHYALNTQHAYQRDLEQLLSFINQQGVNSWIDLTGEHLNLLVMKMRHANSSGRTIRRHLSSIRGFLTYLVNQRYLSSNCALGLQPPRLDQNLPKILDYGQLTLMLNPRSKSPSELRDVAIIEVIYSCGLRVSELVGLDVNDMDAEQGFLSVMGKGGKMRHTPLGKSAQRAIANYLQKTGVTQGALFLNNRHVRISVRAIQTMVKKRALEVGIKINVHPHMLRHAAAT
ncbi:MAG TPA: recombinase XerC, partial [Gammaproteobacteria bacterium]|nr:recombinase XerC [Gammaproteobacteria bacterium]